jgi:hypothetical protein
MTQPGAGTYRSRSSRGATHGVNLGISQFKGRSGQANSSARSLAKQRLVQGRDEKSSSQLASPLKPASDEAVAAPGGMAEYLLRKAQIDLCFDESS